ncbi:hypothetical protein VNI00_013311 [Paramarasmius palmivorus]|uniref:Uncharacterized protein n=1 Tax=Paramarasmius palmivorus TaxID=297713 RepID=A0AAW0BZ41_9AGAR
MSALPPIGYANQLVLGAHTAARITEGACNGTPSVSTKFLLLLGSVHLLCHFGPSIVQWRFPCQTTEEIDVRIQKVESLIDSNSYLDNDILGETSNGFKAWLEELCDEAHKLRIRACREPSRANLLAWGMYRWKFLRDLDACYKGLKDLEGEIEETIRAARIAKFNA